MTDAYLAAITSLSTTRSLNVKSPLKFVNTSLHGVSHAVLAKTFALFGFPPFTPVKEQQLPDPDFPTVTFPNPEEKGFKFIGNAALALAQDGYDVPFGYEEAIGYMFGSEIRDKDGVAATMMFAELIASLHHDGKTATSYLQELYEQYGYFQGTPAKPSYPRTLAGLNIASIRDLTIGYDSTNPPTYKPTLPLSSGHMIQFRAESPTDGAKITLTISGKQAGRVAKLLRRVVSELADEWMESSKNRLGRP
ncbi:hypothetical protein PHLCEN_2v2604 [Hermanssonia centrifuga]|uniref:Alpha-D-phosphohexomutase alpha/beta/alpha domain-containing protein n=1 Tax=Hermanssonia centrifuga TaxID=98765 RepID=A0A2R6RLH7_9APHY|nr:hypothetical protein PHLCEN_2v2604 [Hermanssonia centrifuga]